MLIYNEYFQMWLVIWLWSRINAMITKIAQLVAFFTGANEGLTEEQGPDSRFDLESAHLDSVPSTVITFTEDHNGLCWPTDVRSMGSISDSDALRYEHESMPAQAVNFRSANCLNLKSRDCSSFGVSQVQDSRLG
jgi:hypothetical protein